MSDKEGKKEMNAFGRGVLKCLGFLGLTSGIGLMIVGGFYFIWGIVMLVLNLNLPMLIALPYLQVSLLGLISVGIGVMCNELKLISTK